MVLPARDGHLDADTPLPSQVPTHYSDYSCRSRHYRYKTDSESAESVI